MVRKIVLVGDSGCGKTALAIKVSENLFNQFYQPTCFESYNAEVATKKGRCNVSIMDTSGCHSLSQLREPAYKDCDAVIVCFDLTDKATLSSIEKKWVPEIKQHCPAVPVFIAGCKRDAMCERECNCGGDCCTVSEDYLLDIVSRTGAVAYLECSAAETRYEDGVEELFKFVAETSGKKKRGILSSIKKRSKLLKRPLSLSL